MSLAYKDSTHPEFEAPALKTREPSVGVKQGEIPVALDELHKQLDSLGEQVGYLLARIDPVTAPRKEDVAEPAAEPARTVLGRALKDATDKVLRLRAVVGSTADLVQL